MKRGAGASFTAVCLVATIAGPAWASAPAQVRLNQRPRLAVGTKLIGGLAADTPIHLTITLKPRRGLAAFVAAVSDPGSPLYRHYVTPAEFRSRFGATRSQIAAVDASLRAHGLTPGRTSAGGLSIPVTAHAGAVEHAFSLSLERVRLADGRHAVLPSVPPAIDSSVAGDVQAVVGLDSVYRPHPLLTQAAAAVKTPPHRGENDISSRIGGSDSGPRAVAHVATGGPQPCSAASSSASSSGAYTADQLASAYRFSGLYGAGDQGQGQTIAMYELEPNDPADIAAYQSCYGTATSVQYVSVDGGAGSGAGAGEAALDIEVAIGLAPRAAILVYQGPNSSQTTPGSGSYDTFSAIVNQDRAQIISTSWGDCEPNNGSANADAENTLFQQAAAEGQSILAAAGDTGSEDCTDAAGTPLPALTVDDPGSQPLVTSVGGTTLHGLGPPPAETVWNAGGNATAFVPGATSGATGGGVSQLWTMPGYQAGAAASLGVSQPNSSGSPCGASSGLCRQVPDVAADADPASGYVIYYNGSGTEIGSPSGWQVEGGTSAGAPLWAALLALVNGDPACHGSAVGFANPAFYAVAGSAYAANFNDITSGDNDYTGTGGGLYPAAAGYDMATGLGTPDAAALAASLCPDTFRLVNPGNQVSTVGQSVSLQLRTNGSQSAVTYAASGLPPGLSLGSSSGQITGRPSRAGTYRVAVVASNRDSAVRGVAFAWVVLGQPRITRASLSGLARPRPRLSLAVAAASGAPGLRTLSVSAPSGMRFVPRRGRVTVNGVHGAVVSVSRGRVQVTLPAPRSQMSLTIAAGAVVGSKSLSARARRRRRVSVTINVSVTDSSGTRTVLKAAIKSGR
jgi:subtilase family serine protease